MIKKLRILLVFIFNLLLFLKIFPSRIYSIIYFEDNFDDASKSAQIWEVIGPQLYNGDGTAANWEFKNGMYGIIINGRGSQYNETVPRDAYWDNKLGDYIFEVDFILKEGPHPELQKASDTNLAFRVQGHEIWYGIHGINAENRMVLQKKGETWGLIPPERSFSFIYNMPYRIKVKLHGENIVVKIKNKISGEETELWDWNDLGTSILFGKPGLQASTGANPYCEVWYDNVVVRSVDEEVTPTPTISPTQTPTPSVTPTLTPTLTPSPTLTPTPTPAIPIVFLPGLGASINYKEMFLGLSDPDGWRMTPGANIYKNLINIFKNDSNFYVFYYDWRRPVTENASKLYEFIENKVHPLSKVNLVGHSLGGLVARTCVQTTTNNCYVNKLITVGSPHHGAVDAYPALEAGEIWRSGPTKMLYELLVHYNQLPGETRRETIRRFAPVLFDLLPTFNYLSKNGENIPPSDLSIKNNLLPTISDLSELRGITNTIAGTGFDTVESIILTEPSWVDKLLGNWLDGKAEQKIYTIEGDTSVLLKSSSFQDPLIENFSYHLDHGEIISNSDPLSKILEILGKNQIIGYQDKLEDSEKYLVFFVHSPVKISSPDIEEINHISDELIIQPDYEDKIYNLKLVGTESGYYSLSVGRISDNVSWNDYFGYINKDEEKQMQFDIKFAGQEGNPLVDPTGRILKEQLETRLKEFEEEIEELKIKKSYKNGLLFHLSQIRQNLTNLKKSSGFLSLLRIYIANLEKTGIISTEQAILFRKKCSLLAEDLESLSFKFSLKTSHNEAASALKIAEKVKKTIEGKKLSKNGALVFLEGEEKLGLAKKYFGSKKYYPSLIFSLEASSLFTESKLIK